MSINLWASKWLFARFKLFSYSRFVLHNSGQHSQSTDSFNAHIQIFYIKNKNPVIWQLRKQYCTYCTCTLYVNTIRNILKVYQRLVCFLCLWHLSCFNHSTFSFSFNWSTIIKTKLNVKHQTISFASYMYVCKQ